MDHRVNISLYGERVFIPSTVRVGASGYNIHCAPVSILPVGNIENIRSLIKQKILTPAEIIDPDDAPEVHKNRSAHVWRQAGAKTWNSYIKQARSWDIDEEDNHYVLIPLKPGKIGNKHIMTADARAELRFAKAAGIDKLIDTIIDEILAVT